LALRARELASASSSDGTSGFLVNNAPDGIRPRAEHRFDDTVFKRMERYDAQPAARLQQRERFSQSGLLSFPAHH